MRAFLPVVLVAACGDNIGGSGHALSYDWDGNHVVCSQPTDDYQTPEPWDRIEAELLLAQENAWVAIMHGHIPGETISRETLDHIFSIAEEDGLDFVTFRDLDAPDAVRRGALAFAFDDSAVDQWVTLRDLFAQHHAHVTFFVARWQNMTDPQHQELAELAGDGHDIEPHTVNHLHGPDYVAANGMDAYLANEVLPSFQVLTDFGFPPAAAFAYPFGEHTPEMDTAILKYVDRVRTTPGPCPNH